MRYSIAKNSTIIEIDDERSEIDRRDQLHHNNHATTFLLRHSARRNLLEKNTQAVSKCTLGVSIKKKRVYMLLYTDEAFLRLAT